MKTIASCTTTFWLLLFIIRKYLFFLRKWPQGWNKIISWELNFCGQRLCKYPYANFFHKGITTDLYLTNSVLMYPIISKSDFMYFLFNILIYVFLLFDSKCFFIKLLLYHWSFESLSFYFIQCIAEQMLKSNFGAQPKQG